MKVLLFLLLTGCAAMPDCLPKTSIHHEGKKIDDAFVGAYCNDRALNRALEKVMP